MKIAAFLISIFGFLLIPAAAYAEVNVQVSGNEGSSHVSVESQSNGTSTVCQNGKCTTTGGGSSSTVCINGKCTTTGDDVHYESEDGNTRVNIDNNGTNVQVGPTESESEDPVPTETQPAITVDPTTTKEIEDAQKEAKTIEERVKQRVKEQEGALQAFLKAEFESLQKLFDGLFN